MFIIDDADASLKLRHETKIMRISNSIAKERNVLFFWALSDRIDSLAEKMMEEPFFRNRRRRG
jgi:superfamily II DNA/RNA helicase